MEDFFTEILHRIDLRIDGPMKFRLILQPLMSLIFAVKAGLRDAKENDKPFVQGMLQDDDRRKELASEMKKDIGKLFILALILDVVFQVIELKTVHPFGAITTALVLAVIPYLLFRGIVTRIVKYLKKK